MLPEHMVVGDLHLKNVMHPTVHTQSYSSAPLSLDFFLWGWEDGRVFVCLSMTVLVYIHKAILLPLSLDFFVGAGRW